MDKQQLIKQLQEVEQKEKEQYIQGQLLSCEKYRNKCYSTHLFQKLPKPGKEIRVRKITDVYWDKGNENVYYKFEEIVFIRYSYCSRFQFSITESSSNDPFPSWIGAWSHEITPQLFNTVKEQSQALAEIYFDSIKAMFKQDYLITQGDSSIGNSKLRWLSDFEFIDLNTKGYDNINDLIRWNNHPFHYGENKLLNTKDSIEIIKKIADEMEIKMWQWGGSILERDAPRVKALRSFYNQYKH
jgi:hypothetical protein